MINTQILADNAVTHTHIRQVFHPDLQAMVNGSSTVRYLRFGRNVRLDRLELPPIGYGRHAPAVPTHPAHLIISVLNKSTNRWQTVREVDFPRDPRITGDELSQDMTLEEMDEHFRKVLEDQPKVIELGGLETDHLRVECDREHPVWPSHGEMNGSNFSVPFGILNSLQAYGTPVGSTEFQVPYRPILKRKEFSPSAPEGMRVTDLPKMLLFESDRLSIGFSLRRPVIMHLGFDAFDSGKAGVNRIAASNALGGFTIPTGVFCAPFVRTLDADYGHNLFSGEVSVSGNRITYSNLRAIDGLTFDAAFIVEQDRVVMELTQTSETSIPVIEAEAWQIAWNERAGFTAAAGLPTLRPGRNGDVQLPFLWATDGSGALSCRVTDGNARMQIESFRPNACVTGGFVLTDPAEADSCQTIPHGTRKATFELAVTKLEPESDSETTPSSTLQRFWGSVFACFRPELGGFSNNAISVNCNVSQCPPIEVAVRTRCTQDGPDPVDLARFTIARALMDGSGYSYWRNLYLDADPSLVSAAGRIHQMQPDLDWLKSIEPGLMQAIERMASTIGDENLAICRDLSGNSGSFRWSSNAMDVVGSGHIDAYVNTWTYRALKNAAVLTAELGNMEISKKCTGLADGIRASFSDCLLNPETGWVAGWRSRDGKLHDYAFTWVNGPAIAFGLLEPDSARKALENLERLRDEVGPGDARMGIPVNLLPIDEQDHMLSILLGKTYPTFERYTDGALGSFPANYYLRALSIYGLKDRAKCLADELLEGFEAGIFTGGYGEGNEFHSWEGVPTGYEGTLILCVSPMYAIAVEQGVIEPLEPEWWGKI